MNTGSEAILDKVLRSLEKKRKRVCLINGMIEFLLVLCVSLGLISLFAHISSNNVYFSILKTLAITAWCFGFVKFLLPPILKKERKTELAKELERVSAGLGEDTLNAALLMAESQRLKTLGVSKSLVSAHIDKVARRIESLDLSAIVPKEKITTYSKAIAAVFVLSLTSLIFSPREFQSFLFSTKIFPPSEPYLLELADIKVNYTYPDYTEIPPREIKGSTGDIKAIKGTEVAFEATLLKLLDRGNLVIEKAHVIPVNSEKGRIKAEFRILSSGTFFVEDKGGKYRSKVFKITMEEDKNPRVSIEHPGGDIIEVDGGEKFEINYRSDDDFGLTKLMLAWNTKKGESSRLIKQTKEELKFLEGKFLWELASVDSDPGETLEVRIKAYDNDTVSGPKIGVSNVIKVKLKNPRKKHEGVLIVAEKLLDEFLDILGDEIENARFGNMPSNTGQNSNRNQIIGQSENQSDYSKINISMTKNIQEDLTSKIEKALISLDKIVGQMRNDDFSDYTYFLELSGMKIRIKDLLDERRDLIPSFSITDLPRLDSLITKEINEFEDDILFLDSMLKGEKLRESLLYGKDTLSKYNELSELFEKLKQNGDETTRNEIAKKMEELTSLISELTEKLSSLSGEIYDGFLNPDAFESVDLQGKLDEIRKLAEQGKIDEALDLLSSLKTGLQSMIASLESGLQSFSSASLSKEINRLNEIISRMGSIEKEQTNLKGKTENLKESSLKSPPKKENLSDFLERERKKIEQLKTLLSETKARISPDIPESEIMEGSFLIDRALRKTDELEHWLQALEFEEALKRAKEVEEDATGLKNLSKLFWEIAKGDREIRKSERLAREIRKDLENALQRGTREGQSYQIAKRQDELERETSQLGNDIGEFQDDSSLIPQIGEKVSESKGFMHGAYDNLKRTEISKAISNQEEAIKTLKKAREEAEGLLEKYQLSAKGRGLPVPLVLGNQLQPGTQGVDTGYVEIPAPEESQIGKEFKESLLKALKDGSPEGYSELNKRYYDRIIK
jgi:hypothetical protein